MWFIVLESARRTLKGHFNLQNLNHIFSPLPVVIFIHVECFGVGLGDVGCRNVCLNVSSRDPVAPQTLLGAVSRNTNFLSAGLHRLTAQNEAAPPLMDERPK